MTAQSVRMAEQMDHKQKNCPHILGCNFRLFDEYQLAEKLLIIKKMCAITSHTILRSA